MTRLTKYQSTTIVVVVLAIVTVLLWFYQARQELFVLATITCDLDRAKISVAMGAEINPEQILDPTIQYPGSAALASKCDATLSYLIEQGLHETSSNPNHAPYLHQAVSFDYLDGFKSLIAAGFAVEAKDKRGQTTLFRAIETRKIAWLKTLIEHKARVNVLSASGDNPLALSAILGEPEMIKLLLKAGANPNPQGSNALCPISLTLIANSDKHLDAAQILLNAGATLDCPGKLQVNVLEKAKAEGLTEFVEIFSRHQ